MRLTPHEQAMLDGDEGPVRQWAMAHMCEVGGMFDAEDFVAVSQVHMMNDPESVGEAGVAFLENFAAMPPDQSRVRVPMITDPRGVDLERYRAFGQTDDMAALERRNIDACTRLGILMTDTCINYQIVSPPARGDHVAFGDTGVVIYTNSVLGARSNFEGGPSALAAGLTGRTPRYGLHLPEKRRATRRFVVDHQPAELTEWGLLGAWIGRQCNSYWEVPVIEGIVFSPSSDQLKHFGAAMASYGSTPLFHIVGVTPEARTLGDVCHGPPPDAEMVSRDDIAGLRREFGGKGDKVDVVVFAAPQLSLFEMNRVAELLSGRQIHRDTALIVCTAPAVALDCKRLGIIDTIEASGAMVLTGTCFYNQFAREVGEANGWTRLLSNSAKIVNIISGYGYVPAIADMEACVDSAIAGEIV